MNSGMFLIWALTGSIWDIREKKVPVSWLAAGVAAALLWNISGWGRLIAEQGGAAAIGIQICLAAAPGLFLLSASWLTEGAVGVADGWFLIVLGLQLGAVSACFSLIGGILLAGMFSGAGLFVHKLHRKSRIPLLPFLTAGWLLQQMLQIGG